ncbi:MAG TPA: hypothetical protein VMF06_16805 [Candidatus Limnocylindria bacterium]|jgi:hypothetical protein|nr:hypothetical protein [Candidatus Limnocylindria bacterium]
MTGKACIYQRNIQQALADVSKRGRAFMLMPFRSTLDEVYRAQIEPCLRSVVGSVGRADDVTKTGYVVCEKICRQIQESHLVSAELSCDNANVFYELGLAYALERDISIFIQESVKERRSKIIKGLGLGESFNSYNPFTPLGKEQIKLWNPTPHQSTQMNAGKVFVLLADTESFTETVNGQELRYSVDGLCRGAIHRALDTLFEKPGFPTKPERVTVTIKDGEYKEDTNTIVFSAVESKIRASSCVIICTSPDEPASFFWLGFAHGLEKDAVPITVLAPEKESPLRGLEARAIASQEAGMDLPFDMRALWHIRFHCNRPKELEREVETILEIIFTKDKDIYWRRRFWEPFLDEGKVSVFVGSVELTPKNKRHVVGEWDYRTVSELTSFLASTKETMETVIQTPIFQASIKFPEWSMDRRKQYIETLKNELMDGNSIIIASADVNDMTEVALATYANVDPFRSEGFADAQFNGIVAFKGVGVSAFETPSLYFQVVKNAGNSRGFYDVLGGGTHANRTFESPYRSYEQTGAEGYSIYYGHIAKIQLPGSRKWTLVLQGITGPATLGVAQVLSGGMHRQFTVFADTVPSERRNRLLQDVAIQSESLRQIMGESGLSVVEDALRQNSEMLTKKLVEQSQTKASIEAIVRVFIADGGDEHHDERKVIWWDVVMGPREIPTPNLAAGGARTGRRS